MISMPSLEQKLKQKKSTKNVQREKNFFFSLEEQVHQSDGYLMNLKVKKIFHSLTIAVFIFI